MTTGGMSGGSSFSGFACSENEKATSKTTDNMAASAFLAVLNIERNFKGFTTNSRISREKVTLLLPLFFK